MNNILVVNMNWVGDVIFSSPVFRALKENYPEAKLSCLAVPRVADVCLSIPDVDDVIVYDERGKDRFLVGKWRLINNLTKRKLLESFLNTISSTDYDNCVMIQKRINGQEYGMDVVNNLNAEYEATLIRKKIEMRSGETDKAETIHHERLNHIGEEIGKKLKHVGNLDCDLFIDNNEIKFPLRGEGRRNECM